jgi:hypothetical protein
VLMPFQCSIGTREGSRCAAMHGFVQVAVSTRYTNCSFENSFFSLWSRFHASRYPAIPKDTAYKFDPATHNHVVFIRNNRLFEVQLAYPDGTELSAADLEAYESTCISFLDKD